MQGQFSFPGANPAEFHQGQSASLSLSLFSLFLMQMVGNQNLALVSAVTFEPALQEY